MDRSGNLKSGFYFLTPEISQGYPSHPMSVPSFAMIALLSNSDETSGFLYQSRKHENSARELIKHCLRGYFGRLPSGIDLAYDSGIPFGPAKRAGPGGAPLTDGHGLCQRSGPRRRVMWRDTWDIGSILDSWDRSWWDTGQAHTYRLLQVVKLNSPLSDRAVSLLGMLMCLGDSYSDRFQAPQSFGPSCIVAQGTSSASRRWFELRHQVDDMSAFFEYLGAAVIFLVSDFGVQLQRIQLLSDVNMSATEFPSRSQCHLNPIQAHDQTPRRA
ncbi:uncharacterized protein CLUP02_00082 [Colletotrichum lupini]|uniref:Uncharacterized protein n=1 Tax=Colletotrichum lupini TaxID=145971 RepID=A0A9Q8SAA7_9PEZI|nr:uncharacterized protein CLUP02_00082 [Colletotrichum lupini]UQC73438.1 hypothetical protein CLUP02_00082 [Colletotrichum lupini]